MKTIKELLDIIDLLQGELERVPAERRREFIHHWLAVFDLTLAERCAVVGSLSGQEPSCEAGNLEYNS